jgi:hypothetical protein
MHRANAYAALASELESWRQVGPDELAGRIGLPAIFRKVQVTGEEVEIELLFTWASPTCDTVLVTGTARGPSHWRLERLEEVVRVPISAASSK